MNPKRNRTAVMLFLLLTIAVSQSIALFGCRSGGEAEVLGSVEDSVITYEMVDYVYHQNPKNKDLSFDQEYEKKKAILDNLLETQLFAIEAYKNKIHTDPKFTGKMEAERRLIAGNLYHDDYIYAKSELTDEDIKQIFEKFGINDNTSPDTVQILKNRAKALKYGKLVSETIRYLLDKYNVNIDTSMIDLYEKHIEERGFPENYPLHFDTTYFSDEEMLMTIATFDRGTLSLSEFLEGFGNVRPRDLPATGDYKSYLNFIQKRLLKILPAYEAEEMGLLKDPRYIAQWKIAYTRLMSGQFLRINVYKDIVITEKEMRKEYEENRDKYWTDDKVVIDDIVVETEEKAATIIEKLKKGDDFRELALEHSIRDYSRKKGGRIGAVSDKRFKFYYDAAKKANARAGDIVGPIEVETGGYGIIKVRSLMKPKSLKFENVEFRINRDLTNQKQQAAKDKFKSDLLKNYKLTANYKVLKAMMKQGVNSQN